MKLASRNLPYLALAIFAVVALLLELGVAGRPALLFTLGPLLLLVLLSLEKTPVTGILAFAAILLIGERILARASPRWMALLPFLVGLALLRYAPEVRGAGRRARAVGALGGALGLAASVLLFAALPVLRHPALALPMAGLVALCAAASVPLARGAGRRLLAAGLLLACAGPPLALWREDVACEQAVSSGDLTFILTDCANDKGGDDPLCLEVVRRPTGGITFETEGRALLSLCSEFHQWATVSLTPPEGGGRPEIQAGGARADCARLAPSGEGGVTFAFESRGPRAAMVTPGPERVEDLRYDSPSRWGTAEAVFDADAREPVTLDRRLGPVRWRLPYLAPSLVASRGAPGWWTALAAGGGATYGASVWPERRLARWTKEDDRSAAAPWIAGLALDAEAGLLYAAAPLRPEILRLRADALEPLGALSAPRGLTALHLDAARGLLVAVGGRTGEIRALSLPEGETRWTARAGPGPVATAYDAARGLLLGKSRCGVFLKSAAEGR